jgi:rubrerythrin
MSLNKNLQNGALSVLGALAICGCASPSLAVAKADEEALVAALDDEYRAEAIYAAVIKKFGEARPFINIIEAERRHAALVKAEMDRLGISYDKANPWLDKEPAPASLLEACQQGIIAERENIALYEKLLPTIQDAQVRETLTTLQWASRERHLPAFERCVARGGVMGRGPGHGMNGQGRDQ